ncbi:MAG: flagellar filament capping protein FliD [Sideroxydans sp.]|nr:flagellar filament capping protein FliD [Sideroxydans sp.]
MASTAATSGTSGMGVDVNAIVTGLMTIERKPITRLDTKETSYNAQVSALGMIQSKMSTLQTAVQNLGSSSSSSLLSLNASVSDSSIFSATAGSSAVAGTYSLTVSSLAQSQNLVAAGQSSDTAAISDGTATTISFDFGTITGGTLSSGTYTSASFATNGSTVQSITIDGTNNSLAGIRDAINAAGLGVTASIVNDGSATPYRLALSSNNTGVSNSLKITTSGGDGTLNTLLAHDPAGLPAAQHLNQTVAAQNAALTMNGIAITKESNTITDAVQGITLNLSKVTTAPVTLNVTRNTTGVTTAVNSFVTAYNDLFTAMKNSSAYKSGSSLAGDATLRSLQTQMRDIATTAVSSGTLTHLFDAGMSFKTDGTMQLDSAKLNSALSSDFSGVANLFNNSTGFATRFDTWATSNLATTGTFANRTSALNNSIKDIATQRVALEARMVSLENMYRKQYTALNVALMGMNQTSTYLTQQLSRLP